MIEVVSTGRCVTCDQCIKVCPMDVFDRGADGVPVIARQSDCQTCGSLCLDTKPPGRATYVLANETRKQTMNFTVDTGFPPAVTINAGVTRGDFDKPVHPLAHFGVVYFDEISAYTTSGSRLLTSGEAITMVESNGSTLARPVRLNDFAFKAVYAAS